MVRIKYMDSNGSHIGCKKLMCDDSCWKEATREELDKAWELVSGKCSKHHVEFQETWWGQKDFCPLCDTEEFETKGCD